MPLILQTYPLPGTTIGVWQIAEDADWFHDRLRLNHADNEVMSQITVPNKLLEFLASRYLLRVLIGVEDEHTLMKDDHGRPSIENSQLHLSISHCKGYAAAMVSDRQAIGIDIEPIHHRVRKIISKFISDDELVMLGGERVTDEALIIAWTVKEAVYKANGKKGISLRSQIHMASAPTALPAEIKVAMETEGMIKDFAVKVDRLNETMLAFAWR